jgi:cell division protein FtsB
MTVEQLAEVAGENATAKQRRERLKNEIADLEIGRKILL